MAKTEYLKVGLISTTLSVDIAYGAGLPICKVQQDKAVHELREGFRQLSRCVEKPHIIIGPELSVPRGFSKELKMHACKLGAICIFGFDYNIQSDKMVKNEIIIYIPDGWPGNIYKKKTYQYSVFKSNCSPKEMDALKNHGYTVVTDSRLWILETGCYGNIGIANCYDFLDVEMHLLYRAKIQHLFVLSYNKDIQSFYHTAESLCRTLFCNVVICNTGFYGGSLSVSPYRNTFKRTIYRNEGNKLFSTQLIKLPVKSLMEHQEGKLNPEFKYLPPGFSKSRNKKDGEPGTRVVERVNSENSKK
jgi:hypothetical protein